MAATNDEQLYLEATQEVDNGTQAPAIWAKAMALAEGDQEKARYRYITLRVEELSEAPTNHQHPHSLRHASNMPRARRGRVAGSGMTDRVPLGL